jgi:hypothetical protein
MKDIIWKTPWDLYKEYKHVRDQIRNLKGYQELKKKEGQLLISMLVTSVGTVSILLLILYLAAT